jgi:hypothetical protein
MKSFISMWLICSIAIIGMMCVDANPKIFLKDITSPKIIGMVDKSNEMSFFGKLVVCAMGPLALGMCISMSFYQAEENYYKLEQQIKGNKNQ